jgi:hypothetical protein
MNNSDASSVLDVINSTLGDPLGEDGSSIGDTTRQLIEFLPSSTSSTSSTSFSSHPSHPSHPSPPSSISPRQVSPLKEHKNINELLDTAFKPEREQYIKDIEILSQARNKKSSKKSVTRKYSRDLPTRALSEHNKVRNTLAKSEKRIRDLEATNRMLNIELKKYKNKVHQTREDSRRKLNAMKKAHKSELLDITKLRDESKERCRRLYDSLLSAEVTIKNLQENQGLTSSEEVTKLRNQVHENEKISEKIKEATLSLRARAMQAEEKCRSLEIQLSNVGNMQTNLLSIPITNISNTTNTAHNNTTTDNIDTISTNTTTTDNNSNNNTTAKTYALSARIQSVRIEYEELKKDVKQTTTLYIQNAISSFRQQFKKHMEKAKIKEELALVLVKRSPFDIKKRSRKKRKKNDTPSRKETLNTTLHSPSLKKNAAAIAHQVGDALLSNNRITMINKRTEQKLKESEKKIKELIQTNQKILNQHVKEIEPLRELIKVLRSQIEDNNVTNIKRDNVVEMLKQQQQEGLPTNILGTLPVSKSGVHLPPPGTPEGLFHYRHHVEASKVRAAYQEDLLAQSKEIDDIIETVRIIKENRSLANASSDNTPIKKNNRNNDITKRIVEWNGMLEEQNINLEKQLVSSQGELAALRQSLVRSNAEISRLTLVSENANDRLRELENKGQRKMRRRIRNGGKKKLLHDASLAETELRESLTQQIQLLEKEKTILKRELESQSLVIHNLTQYQDTPGDEF